MTGLINAIMHSPDWDSTAIFLAWDDWGGFYDHVKPPARGRPGLRPARAGLVISPYAKKGYIDHQTLSFDAYLKFIEDDFLHGQRIDPRTDGRPDPRPDVRENAGSSATSRATSTSARSRGRRSSSRSTRHSAEKRHARWDSSRSPSRRRGAAAAACGRDTTRRTGDIHEVRHVIVIMEENRSFDSFFGTYPRADGIPRRHGRPTVCVPNGVGSCVRPFLDANGADDSGGPHGPLAGQRDVNGGRMDGFIRVSGGTLIRSASAIGAARRASTSAARTS